MPRTVRATVSVLAVGALSALGLPSASHAAVAQQRVEIPIASTSTQTDVVSSVVKLRLPMLPGAASHPEACDWIAFARFRSASGPANARDADAVAVLFPGVLEGATAFDPVARNAIRESARRGRSIEVWGIDRRANCLEDHTGLEASERSGDPADAIDYYYRGKSIGGKTFAGFKVDDRVLGDIGIAQTMHDYNDVLTNELPGQAWREKHVICGGHSMGGPLTEIYAGWDFDGNAATTEDAGYRQCAGFIGFDTALNFGSTNNTASNDLLGKLTAGVLGSATKGTVNAIKAGTVPRKVDLLGINPESMTALELVGDRASQAPDGDSAGALQAVPKSPGIEAFFHIAGSPDMPAYLFTNSTIRDYRYSNMALLGQILDDNGAVYGLVRTSFGFFDGAPVRRSKLPEQAQLVPGLGALVSPGPLVLPQTRGTSQPLMKWRNYDALGSGATQLGAGYTTPADEVTNAADLARILHEGPLSLTENWFPIRLLVEQGLLTAGDRSGSLSGLVHKSPVLRKPRIAVISSNGLFAKQTPVDPRVMAQGYEHLDVLTAAEKQNDGRPEISSQTLANLIDTAVAR